MVKCSEVQDRLSAYFDGELSNDEHARIAGHLSGCAVCAEELAIFGKLSEMSASLPDPSPPPPSWKELEAELDNHTELRSTPVTRTRRASRVPIRRVAIAASLLIAVSLIVVGYRTWFRAGEHRHLAINFEQYLAEFDKNPENAQQFLLAQYNGRPTTLQQATSKLEYEPVVAQGLPSGCSLQDVYLLEMPCCTCAQAVCRCDENHHIAVFEHDIDQPVWFGDRPTIDCLCAGRPTSVVQIGDRLAATWKQGNRFVTIIGARDLEDVTRFVTSMNASKPNG